MNKDKVQNQNILGTLVNKDESGIIAYSDQIYDKKSDRSLEEENVKQNERLDNIEIKDREFQSTLENITKTVEASAASNVSYNHNDSQLDASNVQQAIDEVYSKGNTNRENDKTELEKSISDNKVAVDASIQDVYKKSNYNDGDNIIDFNTIHLITDNPEYIKALTDSVGKLIEAIGIDGIRRFFAGINVQGTLQCITDNPEYIAVWLDNQNRIVFGFKINGDPYFGYGVPSQISSLVEALKSNTEARIDALQQSIDNNILALDYNSDTGELYALTGETSTINASMDDNGDVYLEQEII